MKTKRKLPALKRGRLVPEYYDFEEASNDELIALRDNAYDTFAMLLKGVDQYLPGDFEEIIIELEKRSNQ